MTLRISKALVIALVCLVLSSKGFKKSAWMTPYGSAVRGVNNAKFALETLKSKGVTRIYLDVFTGGYIYAQSKTYSKLVGGDTRPDFLATLCTAAQAVGGVEIVAWFEYGLIASSSQSLDNYGQRAKENGWILGKAGSHYWLNPANSGLRTFYSNMVKDIVNNYKKYSSFKGIQLDDHFSVPNTLGGSSEAHGLDQLIQLIAKSIGSKWVSLSPSPMPESLKSRTPTGRSG